MTAPAVAKMPKPQVIVAWFVQVLLNCLSVIIALLTSGWNIPGLRERTPLMLEGADE
jgi:hypothetical protein